MPETTGGPEVAGVAEISEISERARTLVTTATAAGLTVATAESLTAGDIAARIADVPGASAVLRGGLVVYATDLKHSLAGVDAALLDAQGPVDADVAAALAEGAATRCGADIGLGVTGVAGPDGQDGHPVGEVYIAVHCVPRPELDRVVTLDRGRIPAAPVARDDLRRVIRSATAVRALQLAVDTVSLTAR